MNKYIFPTKAFSGFTFIEALACLLVVTVGLASAVALTWYAATIGTRSQSKATAMSTALSVACDPAPLMHSNGAQWTSAGPSGIGTSSGYVNGYFVVRVESVGSIPIAGFASDPVSVDVYAGERGELAASYTTRLMRQGNSP